MDWIELALAIGLFMVSHRLPAALGLKGAIVHRLGERGYIFVFSALSIALLWWLISAVGRAPFVPLWDQAGWHRWVVNIVMPMAIALGSFGIAAPNPFAFEGRQTGFDPDHPGIAGVTRQPLLWALALWSGAHLLPNGDLAHVILFAPFLLLALIGMKVMEARRRQIMGAAAWQHLTARTGLLPFAAMISGRWKPLTRPSLGRFVLALLLWVGLWHLHAPIIGVWPAP